MWVRFYFLLRAPITAPRHRHSRQLARTRIIVYSTRNACVRAGALRAEAGLPCRKRSRLSASGSLGRSIVNCEYTNDSCESRAQTISSRDTRKFFCDTSYELFRHGVIVRGCFLESRVDVIIFVETLYHRYLLWGEVNVSGTCTCRTLEMTR